MSEYYRSGQRVTFHYHHSRSLLPTTTTTILVYTREGDGGFSDGVAEGGMGHVYSETLEEGGRAASLKSSGGCSPRSLICSGGRGINCGPVFVPDGQHSAGRSREVKFGPVLLECNVNLVETPPTVKGTLIFDISSLVLSVKTAMRVAGVNQP